MSLPSFTLVPADSFVDKLQTSKVRHTSSETRLMLIVMGRIPFSFRPNPRSLHNGFEQYPLHSAYPDSSKLFLIDTRYELYGEHCPNKLTY